MPKEFVRAVVLSSAAVLALTAIMIPASAKTMTDGSDSVDMSLAPTEQASGRVSAADGSAVTGSREQHGAFSLLFENDIFFKTDRDYTSGEELAYTTAPDETPDFLVQFANDLPDALMAPGEVRASYEIGQDIFTPTHTHLAVPIPTERPYAGFLYVGLGLLARNENHLDQLELQLGATGPASLAEDSQDFVHQVLGQAKPAGWHFQLHDEPIVQLTYERSFKLVPPESLLGLFFDVEPHYGVAIGNAYDYVNGGAMARIGINLPDDFGPLRMDPALPGSNFFDPDGDLRACVFAGVDGRAIARNIFLDGNSFEHSASVNKENFVADFQLGAAISMDWWRLSFTHVWRTREYATQPRSDQFGAVNLSFRT